jgi:hypothetical protein
MARGRRGRWNDLDPDYRRRLERQGISRRDYESGVSLAGARGHGSRERERTDRAYRSRARKLQGLYGPKDILDQPAVPVVAIDYALRTQGEDWTIATLQQREEDQAAYLRGELPHAGDPDYGSLASPQRQWGESDAAYAQRRIREYAWFYEYRFRW